MTMTDYWLSKLFFDLQAPGAGAEYRADRGKVLARYALAPEVKEAILADDVTFLARRVNPFGAAGMSDEVFRRKLREGASEAQHG
jgi:hypothetical protein